MVWAVPGADSPSKQVAADGVDLDLLDEGELALAVDLQLDEGVLRAAHDEEQIVLGDVDVDGVGAVAVEDGGDLGRTAGTAGGALPELGADLGDQDGGVAHGVPSRVVRTPASTNPGSPQRGRPCR